MLQSLLMDKDKRVTRSFVVYEVSDWWLTVYFRVAGPSPIFILILSTAGNCGVGAAPECFVRFLQPIYRGGLRHTREVKVSPAMKV